MHLARTSLVFVMAAAGSVCGACHHVSHNVSQPSMQVGARPHVITNAAIAAINDSVRAVLDRSRADSAFPGAIAVVGTHDRVLAEYGVGSLDWAPSPRPDDRTMWDLASLSKVVGMTSAMMQLVGEGK